ncbi:hypothetical protein E4L95_18280 [Paracoccus liaowanqingii]|uniref:Uncharacterized protein n=1 Tax=Paracoccus liaowanqingii TaxID=2560053 RepID=A0A4Z1C5V2_9RHOB|nr:hypothetical protein [Paracoccus liaowanqingii]TGN49409.1 hypothetical protein E4L95_18280 [Paracoccus liaowanqingii]
MHPIGMPRRCPAHGLSGCSHTPDRESTVRRATLARFNPQEIEKYATNFLRAISGEKIEGVAPKVQKFLSESSQSASDLRENPLLLGLMIYIFNSRGDVPNNRPEIYKECSLLMFEKWDQRRDIRFSVPNDFYLIDLFSFLASKIFGDSEAEEGVDAQWLERTLREYFDEWYKDRSKSVVAARTLVDFITGRAWVMCEIGPGVFKFTHRTFLEYFFARRIEEEAESVRRLVAEHIYPRAVHAEWDVVTHLALQISTFRSGPKSKQAIEALMEQLDTPEVSVENRINYLHFFIRTLNYLVISEIEASRVCEAVCNKIMLLQHRAPIEIADLFHSLFEVKGVAADIIRPLVASVLHDAINGTESVKLMNARFVLSARVSGFRGYSQSIAGAFDFGLVRRTTRDSRASLKETLYEKSKTNIEDARSYFHIYRDRTLNLLTLHGMDFLLPSQVRQVYFDEKITGFLSVAASLKYVLKSNGHPSLANFGLTAEDANHIFNFLFSEMLENAESLSRKFSININTSNFEAIDSCFQVFIGISHSPKGLIRKLPELAAHFALLIVIRNGMEVGALVTEIEDRLRDRRYRRLYDGFNNSVEFFADKSNNPIVAEIISREGAKLGRIFSPDL